jgi:hypothetical protein
MLDQETLRPAMLYAKDSRPLLATEDGLPPGVIKRSIIAITGGAPDR